MPRYLRPSFGHLNTLCDLTLSEIVPLTSIASVLSTLPCIPRDAHAKEISPFKCNIVVLGSV